MPIAEAKLDATLTRLNIDPPTTPSPDELAELEEAALFVIEADRQVEVGTLRSSYEIGEEFYRRLSPQVVLTIVANLQNALPDLLALLAERDQLRAERDGLRAVLGRIETAVMAPPGDAPPPETFEELAEYVENELEAKANFWESFQRVAKENQRLREALTFYAEDYEPDGGYTARAALEREPEVSDGDSR